MGRRESELQISVYSPIEAYKEMNALVPALSACTANQSFAGDKTLHRVPLLLL